MRFNDLILEELRRANDLKVEIVKGPFETLMGGQMWNPCWDIIIDGKPAIWTRDAKSGNGWFVHMKDFDEWYRSLHVPDSYYTVRKVVTDKVQKALKKYELKNSLSKDTENSFSDLIDIVSEETQEDYEYLRTWRSNLKKGDKVEVRPFTVRGFKATYLEVVDSFRDIALLVKEGHNIDGSQGYTRYNLSKLFPIDWELRKSLTKDTKDSFSDLLSVTESKDFDLETWRNNLKEGDRVCLRSDRDNLWKGELATYIKPAVEMSPWARHRVRQALVEPDFAKDKSEKYVVEYNDLYPIESDLLKGIIDPETEENFGGLIDAIT